MKEARVLGMGRTLLRNRFLVSHQPRHLADAPVAVLVDRRGLEDQVVGVATRRLVAEVRELDSASRPSSQIILRLQREDLMQTKAASAVLATEVNRRERPLVVGKLPIHELKNRKERPSSMGTRGCGEAEVAIAVRKLEEGRKMLPMESEAVHLPTVLQCVLASGAHTTSRLFRRLGISQWAIGGRERAWRPGWKGERRDIEGFSTGQLMIKRRGTGEDSKVRRRENRRRRRHRL